MLTDQGQGAGQAIEDAATLSVVLPKGTPPEEVPDRLRLYEKIRYKRAHQIQEYSRQAGKDWIDGKPQVDSKLCLSSKSSSLLSRLHPFRLHC